MRNLIRLGALGIGLVAGLALAAPASAGAAAGGSYGLSGEDLSAARAAASTPDTLASAGRFFTQTGDAGSATSIVKVNPTLTGDAVAVYTLNPAFVKGTGAPVALLGYVASTAVAADGRTATIWTAKTAAGWSVVNIASGNDETRYAAQAGPDAMLFTEPQTNAWYSAKGSDVLPLNAEARAAIGDRMSLADYQRLVHKRYADKLPGSAYDKSGRAGGYSDETPTQWPWFAGAGLIMLGLITVPRWRTGRR